MIKRVQASFTLQDLLAHVDRQEGGFADGFYTLREWARHFEMYDEGMRRLLVEAKEAGKLEIQRAPRESLDGRMMRVPVYRFVLEGEQGEGGQGGTGFDDRTGQA